MVSKVNYPPKNSNKVPIFWRTFGNGAVSAGGVLNTEDKKGKQDVDTILVAHGSCKKLSRAVLYLTLVLLVGNSLPGKI